MVVMDTSSKKKIFSVMGPHANENAEGIFSRKIKDIEDTGQTFWVMNSYKSKPIYVQDFCKNDFVEVFFISPSSKGGAKDTKTINKNTQHSKNKQNWVDIPSNISPVTGKGYALILSSLEMNKSLINLHEYGESKDTPIKFRQGCSTVCAIKENMFHHEDRMKSNIREVWAVGTLKYPYCVWVR